MREERQSESTINNWLMQVCSNNNITFEGENFHNSERIFVGSLYKALFANVLPNNFSCKCFAKLTLLANVLPNNFFDGSQGL